MVLSALSLGVVAQWTGIVMPTFYTGMAFQDTIAVFNSTRINTPPKLLGKQWLLLYQQGPYWVIPVVLAAIFSNIHLSLSNPAPTAKRLYTLSAFLLASIPLTTIIHFEPGINGACKWKLNTLLADEGFHMGETNSLVPLTSKQSASPKTRLWADKVTMQELVERWARKNVGRCVVAGAAVVLSGVATFCL
ncbi:hypothetical protein OQA88_11140 [Cercophora sp. LCS_1]